MISDRKMPSKSKGEEGVKSKGRSKKDKAIRTFELNGTYSSKHMRMKAERDEASKEKRAAAAADGPPGMRRLRSWGENSLLASLPETTKPKGVKKK